MSREKHSAEAEFLSAVELSPPDMYVEEEFADVGGTSPSSMMRKKNHNKIVNLDEDLEKGGTVNESIVNITIEIASAENVNLVEDLEKGGTVNDSIINTTIEIASADYNHESHNLSRCRICHSFRVNNEIMEIIHLGCSCKLDLSRAHKLCAEIWFQQKGNRRCEICHRRAKNIPTVPISSDPVDSDADFVGCGFWLRRRLIAFVLCWVAMGIFLYKVHTGDLGTIYVYLAVVFSIVVLCIPLFVNAVIICREIHNM